MPFSSVVVSNASYGASAFASPTRMGLMAVPVLGEAPAEQQPPLRPRCVLHPLKSSAFQDALYRQGHFSTLIDLPHLYP
jgi:hypothetical protein